MKCDGLTPCQYCQTKALECVYSKIDGRSLKAKAYSEKMKLNSSIDRDNSQSNGFPSINTSSDKDELEPEIPSLTHSPNQYLASAPTKVTTKTSSPPLSLSIICENLQTALTSGAVPSSAAKDQESKEGLPNLNGAYTRLLTTKTGNLRFFGESSALSLLGECRSLFRAVSGSSRFTDDPVQQFITDESVDYRNLPVPVQLPTKADAFILIDLFKTNINDTFYIFNMKYFNKNIFEQIYRDPVNCSTKKLCLLYNVFAIGRLFSESSRHLCLNLPTSEVFFNSAQVLLRSNVFDGKIWMCEVYFLEYFYFQSCCNRSNAWIQLGSAIRIAQALGLHRRCINARITNQEILNHRRRLWRSLYVCDCVSSVNLGRPLMVNDYDYDDADSEIDTENLDEVEKIRVLAQKATSDSAAINAKIVENIFKDGVVNIKRAHLLALQLKIWSVQLPKELQLSAAMESQMESGTDPNNYLYVFVHIGQLYGIMTLTRPFLVYVVTRKLKPETKQQVKDEQSLMNFCKACIKASFLVIKLLKFFVTHNPHRKEVFTIQSACFFASIILGFTLLEQRKSTKPDLHYISVLQDTLLDGYNILNNYADFNITCKRWAMNLQNMMNHLKQFEPASARNSQSPQVHSEGDPEPFNDELVSWGIDNRALEEVLNFQQYFVPTTTSKELDDILNGSPDNNYIKSNIAEASDFLDAFRYDNREHVIFGERE
ncbi:Fungal specific transcription factor domain family protein [Candida parapsilosis]|uniref:Fungal_trans domain-containing protein n=2 Tax=Candida parapsilosis TaxID=5480 RepID=G8BDS1_CANPC|nr:uncharacterized protein CPAR2_210620 [Candida parapsilosis]KAF6054433.1 Fungal specific transcription factor domain family protein [Candida parapsilosis]KAF6056543.1 Fungal specific transcription factor domain family protein [Candida parapsilosis]KAF6059478.1 Fungal specific transcription factor domain family protein [Candida parapsilosis]KAF6068231.1 Fungal specific transcription factor domain family protein [Candida parapsilosis]CCE43418.1 hypothetical protein CPAR2_210620 [Candida paraps